MIYKNKLFVIESNTQSNLEVVVALQEGVSLAAAKILVADYKKDEEAFANLASKIEDEIAWLETTIPTQTGALKRLCQENQYMLKAFKRVLKRLDGD